MTDRIAAMQKKQNADFKAHLDMLKAKRNDPKYIARAREFKCAR